MSAIFDENIKYALIIARMEGDFMAMSSIFFMRFPHFLWQWKFSHFLKKQIFSCGDEITSQKVQVHYIHKSGKEHWLLILHDFNKWVNSHFFL